VTLNSLPEEYHQSRQAANTRAERRDTSKKGRKGVGKGRSMHGEGKRGRQGVKSIPLYFSTLAPVEHFFTIV